MEEKQRPELLNGNNVVRVQAVLGTNVSGNAGRSKTRGLFKQFADPSDNPIYDIDEFHRVFIAEGDLTEYKAAMKLVGSWAEWNRIKKEFKTFNQFLTVWKEELEVKLSSQAMEKLVELSNSKDKPAQALQAAKWIAEAGWHKNERGRPSSKEKQREAKELAKAAAETGAEAERVFALITGGKSAVNEE